MSSARPRPQERSRSASGPVAERRRSRAPAGSQSASQRSPRKGPADKERGGAGSGGVGGMLVGWTPPRGNAWLPAIIRLLGGIGGMREREERKVSSSSPAACSSPLHPLRIPPIPPRASKSTEALAFSLVGWSPRLPRSPPGLLVRVKFDTPGPVCDDPERRTRPPRAAALISGAGGSLAQVARRSGPRDPFGASPLSFHPHVERVQARSVRRAFPASSPAAPRATCVGLVP
jgi:hypothetical protein